MEIKRDFKELIPQLSAEEYSGLEESIKKEGCRDALILWKNILVDGHNRYDICTKHKIPFKTISKEFEDETSVKIWIIQNQLSRRNLSPYKRGDLAEELERLYEGRVGRPTTNGGNITTIKGKTRDLVAKQAQISGKTYDKIKLIKRMATPEVIQRVDQSEISINKAYKDIKREEKKKEFMAKDMPLPDGKFNVIYADPPWKYEHSETKSRDIENQYPTMTLESIKLIEIPADKDCVLFLWATAPKLQEAMSVMNSWGFSYRTCAVWDKETIGMGYWFRGQHELLLVGVKGNMSPPFEENRVSSVYREKKSEHSKKPEFYYSLIEEMFPKAKYLEMFARGNRKGWTTWGNQI